MAGCSTPASPRDQAALPGQGSGGSAELVFPAAAVAGAFAAFILIGALASCFGPLLPYFEARYGVPRPEAGGVVTAYFTGSLAGVGWASWAGKRLASRVWLLAALGMLAAGTLVVAVAPGWPVVLAGTVVAGTGFGSLDFGLNRLFSLGFGGRKGAMLNTLNALYGAGAVAGPLLVAAAGQRGASWVFAGMAALAVAVAPGLARVGGGKGPPPADAGTTTACTANAGPANAGTATAGTATAGTGTPGTAITGKPDVVFILFVCGYLLYMGVESGITSWEPTQLRAAGYSAPFADGAASAFWLFLTAGRLLMAPVTLRVRARTIVLASLASSVLMLAVATAPAAPYAYALAGLALAAVFPTGLAWAAEARPEAVTWLLTACMIGGAALPLATGWIIQRAGADRTAAVVGSIALACTAVFAGIAILSHDEPGHRDRRHRR